MIRRLRKALVVIAAHLLRRWYVYATFLVLFLAPYPLMLAVALVWVGYFFYRVKKG